MGHTAARGVAQGDGHKGCGGDVAGQFSLAGGLIEFLRELEIDLVARRRRGVMAPPPVVSRGERPVASLAASPVVASPAAWQAPGRLDASVPLE